MRRRVILLFALFLCLLILFNACGGAEKEETSSKIVEQEKFLVKFSNGDQLELRKGSMGTFLGLGKPPAKARLVKTTKSFNH